MSKQHTKESARRYLPLIGLAFIVVTSYFLLHDFLSFDLLAQKHTELTALRDNNYALILLLYILAYVIAVAISLPGATFLTLLGGFLFGLYVGTITAVFSATLGASIIFLIAKTSLGDTLYARLSGQSSGLLERIKKGLAENQISFLLTMRLIPIVPFFIANLAPAFLNVSLLRFVWTTFLGIIPGTFVYTSVGVGLGSFFARNEAPDLGIIFEWQILLPLLGLSLLSLLPVLLKLLRKGKSHA